MRYRMVLLSLLVAMWLVLVSISINSDSGDSPVAVNWATDSDALNPDKHIDPD